MIKLDCGIKLPLPRKVKGFKKPEDVSERRWRLMSADRWYRAYMHCLHSLPNLFELPLHSVIPRMSKRMMEASDPYNVALRFMGELELAGYVKFKKGYDERVVVPTKKFLKLDLDTFTKSTAISMPKIIGKEELPEHSPIRGGVASKANKKVAAVTKTMANERFRVNKFSYELLKLYPPEFDKVSSGYMFKRAMATCEFLIDEVFTFPYFLDSRARMYTDTTCGITPQGADHEKALVIPVYAEKLTEDGFQALIETALGYAEQEWSVSDMVMHAKFPERTKDAWMSADKPYSYMACADLIRQYFDNPSQPLPAFIPLDGRCSGLQHWSALTRSNAITRHIGMHIDEALLDIYEKVAEDWGKILPTHQLKYATRKSAKIPVMTWGYNATMMTSIEHMSKLFGAKTKWSTDEEKYVVVGDGLDRKLTSELGVGIYRKLNETLGPLRAAVDWVSDCAVIIAEYGNCEIHWPTPDGFECMQRKVKGTRKQLRCTLSNAKLFELEILEFSDIPNTAKHRSAIAPNIIHSLDATHLRMVARRLANRCCPMIFIHDSFATHCNYREQLYSDIVSTFIELYEVNIMEFIRDYWIDTYCVELPDAPKWGDWKPESLQGLKRFFA